MRRRPRFLLTPRQIRRLPLWAVVVVLVAVLALTLSDQGEPVIAGTSWPAHASTSTSTSAAPSGRVEARVVRVADGDTLTAQTRDGRKLKVRLARIDAPETGHGRARPGQPFGEASARSLRQLVAGGKVRLDCPEIDRYQRQVCWVVADGVEVNLEQVRRGMAWVYRPPRAPRREVRALSPLLAAQDEARQAARGLWQEPEPIAPWGWRRQCWQAGKCESSGR